MKELAILIFLAYATQPVLAHDALLAFGMTINAFRSIGTDVWLGTRRATAIYDARA